MVLRGKQACAVRVGGLSGDKRLKDTAYYYPAPYWVSEEGDWIKSLLLFFDEVAILLPDYMRGRPREADPSLAGPLEEQGLLRILEPKEWIDAEVTEKLAEVMVDLLAGGVFDQLPDAGYFAELSQSRIGYGADLELAEFLTDELRQRGLARPSEDGVSIPLHPVVRTTILVILGQLARGAGERRGMVLHPATNCPAAASDLIEALSRKSMPSYEGVVKLDLEPVTLDLSSIPLEEVLELREEHRDAHKAYMRSLCGFMVELGRICDPSEREVGAGEAAAGNRGLGTRQPTVDWAVCRQELGVVVAGIGGKRLVGSDQRRVWRGRRGARGGRRSDAVGYGDGGGVFVSFRGYQ